MWLRLYRICIFYVCIFTWDDSGFRLLWQDFMFCHSLAVLMLENNHCFVVSDVTIHSDHDLVYFSIFCSWFVILTMFWTKYDCRELNEERTNIWYWSWEARGVSWMPLNVLVWIKLIVIFGVRKMHLHLAQLIECPSAHASCHMFASQYIMAQCIVTSPTVDHNLN